MTPLEAYYNKFNEEKRLNSRHGQVEFITSMHYIHRYLDRIAAERGCPREEIRIMDLGAGTGRYSIPLSEEGYDVSAVELVNHNLGRLKQNGPKVHARQGNALNLKKYEDNFFDLTLLFGPLYHLPGFDRKKQALSEALRITRPGGYVMSAYIMNEYSVLIYAFREQHVLECLGNGDLDSDWHVTDKEDNLYSYVRLEDVRQLDAATGAVPVQIVSADGPANHMRRELNALNEEQFARFLEYHLATCERPELLGAAGHIIDIVSVS